MTFPAAKPSPLPTMTPKQYVVLRTTQHCTHCSTIHESCTILLKGELPARMGEYSGAKVTQMTALKGAPQFDLPITAMTKEVVQIPFCHECLGRNPTTNASEASHSTAVSHLPLPPIEDTRILKPIGRYGVTAGPVPETKASEASNSRSVRTPRRTTDELLADIF